MCKQNFHKANHCIKQLYKKGFDVLSVRLDGPRPRIEIAPSKKCGKVLDGHWYKRTVTAGCVTYRMVARLHGCQIEWIERRPV